MFLARAPPSLDVAWGPVLEIGLAHCRLQPRECTPDVIRVILVEKSLLVVEVGLVHVEIRQNIVVKQMAILLPSDIERPAEWGACRTAAAVFAPKERSQLMDFIFTREVLCEESTGLTSPRKFLTPIAPCLTFPRTHNGVRL